MNPIKVLEWKGMYPIKKILLVMIWLFGCFLCVAGIIIFVITTLIISKKPGNTGISRDIRTEFTTDLLLSD